MSNLILTEWFKLKLNKTFRIMLSLSLLASLCFTVLLWLDSRNIIALADVLGFINFAPSFSGSGLEVLKLVIVDDSIFFTVISATLGGFFISNEYVTGVIKNQIIAGHERSRIYTAKLIVFAMGTLSITLLYLFISTIGATIISGFGQVETGSTFNYLIRTLILYVLQSISLLAIIMIFSILLQESGKTIIVSIGFIVMINLLILVAGQYLPDFTEAVFSYSVLTQLATASKETLSYGEIIKSLFVALIHVIVIIYLGAKAFGGKEIK